MNLINIIAEIIDGLINGSSKESKQDFIKESLEQIRRRK